MGACRSGGDDEATLESDDLASGYSGLLSLCGEVGEEKTYRTHDSILKTKSRIPGDGRCLPQGGAE